MKSGRFFLQKHFRNAVYSNVWISIGAGLFAYQSGALLGKGSFLIAAFVAFSTFFTYNLQRSVKLEHFKEYRSAGRNNWLVRNEKIIRVLGFIGGLGTLVLALFLKWTDWLILVIPGLFSLFYAMPLSKKKKKGRALRQAPYLKIYLISFTWMVSCIALPAIHTHDWSILHYGAFWWLMAEGLLFIFGITIPFDLRDLPYDHPHQKTIPQLFGKRGALYIAAFALVFSSFCSSMIWASGGMNSAVFLAYNLGNLLALMFVVRTNAERSEMYFSALLDGSTLIKACLVLLALLFSEGNV